MHWLGLICKRYAYYSMHILYKNVSIKDSKAGVWHRLSPRWSSSFLLLRKRPHHGRKEKSISATKSPIKQQSTVIFLLRILFDTRWCKKQVDWSVWSRGIRLNKKKIIIHNINTTVIHRHHMPISTTKMPSTQQSNVTGVTIIFFAREQCTFHCERAGFWLFVECPRLGRHPTVRKKVRLNEVESGPKRKAATKLRWPSSQA